MHAASIVQIAGLIGEAGRIQMLTTLLDGEPHSASQLALAADVSPQTASSHLSKLLSGGLVVSERNGRHRLYRLKSNDVAVAIEALGALATRTAAPPVVPEIRFARSCYDHLAGVLAIGIRDALLKRDTLRHRGNEFLLTSAGERFLKTLDIDSASLRGMRRAFARKCLDWTERHHHLGGALGAALLSQFIDRKWLARTRDTRALRLTLDGEVAFERVMGVRCSSLRHLSRA
jgi:DNA-binding transcriptional ArsR family regulator